MKQGIWTRMAAVLLVAGLLGFGTSSAFGAVMPITAATFSDSDDTESSGIEDDPTTLLGFTVGGMTYSNLQAASSASNYSASRDPAYFWPGADENANEPSNGGDAIANLEVLDGGLNIATVDLGFDTTLDSSRRLFMIEVTGNDEIEVQGFLDGSPVGSVLTIQSGDWGSDLDLDPGRAGIEKAKVFIQYGTDRNNGTEQPMAGVSFLVSDLGAASINGIRIIDNEGPASFDPAVVGYVVPEPATMSLLAIGGLGALIRRRRG